MNCALFCFYTLLPVASPATPADTIPVSMQAVLASARSEESVRLQQKATAYLIDHPLYLPLVDELEFRMGPDDLYFDEQRIAFRFALNGWSAIRRQRQIHNVELERLGAETAVLVEEALFDRYNALSDYAYFQQMSAALQQLESMEDARSQVFSYLIEKGVAVDAIKLVEAEEDWQDARSDLRQWEDKAAIMEMRIRSYLGHSEVVQPNVEDLVSTATIAQRLAATAGPPRPTAEISLKMVESKLDEAEWRLTRSQKFNVLNFVQFDYRDRLEPFEFNRDVSARIGLNIPISGSDKPKIREQQLEWELSKNEYLAETAQQQQKATLMAAKLSKMVGQYDADRARWEKSAIRKLLANAELLNHLSGDDLLQLQIAREKQTIRELEQAYEIRVLYIEYLQLRGLMNGGDLRNELSETGEVF